MHPLIDLFYLFFYFPFKLIHIYIESFNLILSCLSSQKQPKKRVHFNMDNNEEFSYSYAAHNDYSDDENYSSLSSNINFVGYEYMNGNNNSDDDEDDDEDEEEEEESDENDYDTETSEEGSYTGLGKYGYLVDKSSERDQEVNNNHTNSVNNTTSKSNESQDEDATTKEGDSNVFDGKMTKDNESQVRKEQCLRCMFEYKH